MLNANFTIQYLLKPLNENIRKREFDITGNSIWKQIYTGRILRMTELGLQNLIINCYMAF